MNQIYGFEGEVKAKYTAQMFELFSEVFEWLPLAQCINGKVLVRPRGHWSGVLGGGLCTPPHTLPPPSPCPQIMHGGLFSEDGVTLDDIRKIERNRQPPDSGEGPRALSGDSDGVSGTGSPQFWQGGPGHRPGGNDGVSGTGSPLISVRCLGHHCGDRFGSCSCPTPLGPPHLSLCPLQAPCVTCSGRTRNRR